MKKLINIAAVLLAASMIFVGCSNGVAAPGSNNGGSGSGNEAGGSAGGSGSGNDGVTVVFDASDEGFEVPDGMEIVEIDGVKYLKVTPNGYSTTFNVTEVSIAANKKLCVTMKGETDDDGFQAVLQCLEDWNKSVCGENASPTMKPISAEAKEYVADLVGEGKKIKIVQPMVQSTKDWSASSDVTIYISKIIAK